MKIDLEDIPPGSGRWTIHIECGPGGAHTEETWLGTFDEIHARLLDKVHAMTGVKPEVAALVEPEAPKRGRPRSTPAE